MIPISLAAFLLCLAPAAVQPQQTVDSAPLATVAGKPISRAEVDELIGPQLMGMRAEEAQLRSRALEAAIARELVRREAAARGLDQEALEKAEIADKASVSEAEVRAYYEANKARAGGLSEAEALDRIREALGRQRQAERRRAFESELRKKHEVRVLLEPYRVAVEVGDAPVRGNPAAPVTVVEFSDFQCGYCARARTTVNAVRDTYGDRVRWSFRHFPLSFHAQAEKAGEAVACAGDQGRFWEMHDRLWADPSRLGIEDLRAHATTLGLDRSAFDQCLDSGRHNGLVRADMDRGASYGVSGTPAFFINGRPLTGAQPFEVFAEVIDDELRRAGASPPQTTNR